MPAIGDLIIEPVTPVHACVPRTQRIAGTGGLVVSRFRFMGCADQYATDGAAAGGSVSQIGTLVPVERPEHASIFRRIRPTLRP